MYQDSVNAITQAEFKSLLISSEIVVTAIALIGFFFIFRKFVKKQKDFEKEN